MIWETALLVGLLFGIACYQILRASFVRILFGFMLLSHAANLLVLAMSSNPAGREPPVVLKDGVQFVDPLPQALILTAIVIGFGVISYLVILLYRIFLDQKTTNLFDLFEGDRADRERGDDPEASLPAIAAAASAAAANEAAAEGKEAAS